MGRRFGARYTLDIPANETRPKDTKMRTPATKLEIIISQIRNDNEIKIFLANPKAQEKFYREVEFKELVACQRGAAKANGLKPGKKAKISDYK